MLKAIFFDLDGTLLSHSQGRVPQSAVEALGRLRKKGVKLFLSTGRHMLDIRRLAGNISFDGYVTLNGQLCLDAKGKELHGSPMKPGDTKRIVDLFRRKALPTLMVERERIYINFADGKVRAVQESICSPVPKTGDYTGGMLYQASLYCGEEEAGRIGELLPGCAVTRWHRDAVDLIPKEGGKAAGIWHVLKHYGLSRSEIMAFGDGENDVAMLEYAELGVAMGNAGQKVMLRADYVTESVDHDGVQKALEHFGIL